MPHYSLYHHPLREELPALTVAKMQSLPLLRKLLLYCMVILNAILHYINGGVLITQPKPCFISTPFTFDKAGRYAASCQPKPCFRLPVSIFKIEYIFANIILILDYHHWPRHTRGRIKERCCDVSPPYYRSPKRWVGLRRNFKQSQVCAVIDRHAWKAGIYAMSDFNSADKKEKVILAHGRGGLDISQASFITTLSGTGPSTRRPLKREHNSAARPILSSPAAEEHESRHHMLHDRRFHARFRHAPAAQTAPHDVATPHDIYKATLAFRPWHKTRHAMPLPAATVFARAAIYADIYILSPPTYYYTVNDVVAVDTMNSHARCQRREADTLQPSFR